MSGNSASQRVLSSDGTRIAFDRLSGGPPLILAEAAGHYRDSSSFSGLAPLLSAAFTVYTYDRRGRGDSTDTEPTPRIARSRISNLAGQWHSVPDETLALVLVDFFRG